MSKDNGTEPTFDYRNYSRADQRKILDLEMDRQWLGAQIDENARHLTRHEYQKFAEEFRAMVAEIERLMLAYVTHVPREWFVDDAPANVSVDTAEWWLHMRADKLQELKQLAVRARTPAQVSGNLETH